MESSSRSNPACSTQTSAPIHGSTRSGPAPFRDESWDGVGAIYFGGGVVVGASPGKGSDFRDDFRNFL